MGLVDLLLSKQKELLAARVAERRAEWKAFPENALLWAALGPVWTASLARSAGFPAGEADPGIVLDRIAEKGFTEKRAAAPELRIDQGTGKANLEAVEDLYSSGERAVRQIIEDTTDIASRETKIQECIQNIAGGLRQAQTKGAELPGRIVKWLELADRIAFLPGAKDYLLERVDECLTRNDEAGALAWVESAFPLEKAFDGQIALGVKLGGLRVQLHQRRADNERHLRRFLLREEQAQAFRQLLTGPDELWALHFAGSGGVGKTMLVRYLESRGAPEGGAVTARVDFDYLNPEYPTTKPALLLMQLAGELRLSDRTGAAAGFFQSFFDKAQTLHERIGGQSHAPVVSRLEDEEFKELLNMFASAMKQLPGRVVLVLDTCEELAKMKADGSQQAGVEVTFRILEMLHTRIESLRVVFCGRRPLASSGYQWSTVREAEAELPARGYLRLHEIRSFHEAEAREYLRNMAECPAKLVGPVLPHCVEKGYTPLFSTSQAVEPDLRYNPFELSIYAAWVREEKGLEPKDVEGTTLDQYVRTRIIGRIENRELEALLPAIAWVGSVDEKAMAQMAGLPDDSERAAQLSAEMGQQEWIENESAVAFRVPPAMRKRLLDYYAANDVAAYNSGRNAAAAYLERVLPATPVRELLVPHLEAAMEALQPEPERAAAWWQAIESRIVAEYAWDWILPVTLRLLADEHWPGIVLEGRHIRAAVAATRAAAQIHTGDLPGAQETSRRVESDAAHYPDEAEGRRLGLIARALRVEATDFGPGDVSDETVGALLTGLEWALEQSNVTQARTALTLQELLTAPQWIGVRIPLQAFALTLTSRWLATESDRSVPRSHFQAIFGMASSLRHVEQRWRFWLAPTDLASRLKLECLRWAWPEDASPAQLEWWLTPPDRITDVDSDRLASAVLQIKGAQRVPPQPVDDWNGMIAGSRGVFLAEPRLLSVHRRFPPYFAVAAEELANAGKLDTAMNLLGEQTSNLEAAASAFSDALAADRVRARLISRFRLGDEGFMPNESLEYTGDPYDWALMMLHQSLAGIPPRLRAEDMSSGLKIHLRWTTAVGYDLPSAEGLLDWARQAFQAPPAEPSSFADLSCRLDRIEANELAAKFKLPPAGDGAPPHEEELPGWLSVEQHLEIRLRMWALGLGRRADPALVHHVGARRAAAIALGLAEPLALRLPQRSLRMLQVACFYFREAGDVVQEVMASACLALAMPRAGQGRSAHGPVVRIQALFSQTAATSTQPAVQNEMVNPDAWSYIERAVTNPGAYPGLEVQAAWTRPWLLRIALGVALLRDGGIPGAFAANVMQVWRRIGPLPPESLVGMPPTPIPVPAPGITKAFRMPDQVLSPAADSSRKFSARTRDWPLIVDIQCISDVGRPAAGSRMKLSMADNVAELVTPSPTTPYRDQASWPDLSVFNEAILCVVDRAAAWVPWEAVLDPTGERFWGRRTNDKDLPVPNLMNWERISYRTLTMHHAGADLGGSAFGQSGQWGYAGDPDELKEKFGLTGTIQVLHVVADVLEASGGIRLSLLSERENARGRVCRAEELPRMLPDIRLYILQLPVGLNEGRRDAVVREKAALLRTFAAQLQLASHQIVITLPGLRFAEGKLLLEAIRRGAENPTPTAAVSISGELRKARAELFSTLPPDENEAGFDVCYFG